MPNVLDESGNNVELARVYAGLLSQMRSLNPQANIDAVLQLLLPTPFQSFYVAPSIMFPGWYVGGNVTRKVIVIDGATTLRHVSNLIGGYDNAASVGAFSPINFWLSDFADAIIASMSSAHLVTPEYFDIVGYSAGGAAGIVLKDKFVASESNIKTKVLTFGSPRAGADPMRSRLLRSPITRWMVDADPIPLIPPRVTDCPVLIMLQTLLTITRWGLYVHTQGGISLAQNGNTTAAVLPPVAEMNASTSLADWYFRQENDPNNPHSMTTYMNYLDAAIRALPRKSQQDVDDGPAEAVARLTRKQINTDQQRTRAAIYNAGHNQNAVPLVIPEITLFHVFRSSGVWCVALGERIVVQAPIEKRARAVARAGNEFLRALPRQALVDPVALLSQLETFLALAASPESGFSPTINVSLPGQ